MILSVTVPVLSLSNNNHIAIFLKKKHITVIHSPLTGAIESHLRYLSSTVVPVTVTCPNTTQHVVSSLEATGNCALFRIAPSFIPLLVR